MWNTRQCKSTVKQQLETIRAVHTKAFIGMETHKNPNVTAWPYGIIWFNRGVFLWEECKVCFRWTLKNSRYMKLIEACPPRPHYDVSACEWVCRTKSHNIYSILLLYSILLGAALMSYTCTCTTLSRKNPTCNVLASYFCACCAHREFAMFKNYTSH